MALVQLLDFLLEIEALENLLRLGREALDVGDQVLGDVVGVADQLVESELADVVEGLLRFAAVLASDGMHCLLRHALGLQLLILLQDCILRGLQHTVEPAQHRHRQHDAPILRRPIRPAQLVGDIEDEANEVVLVHGYRACDWIKGPPRLSSAVFAAID